MIIDLLRDMADRPAKYAADTPYAHHHDEIFRAAVETGDPRALPLLKQFEQEYRDEHFRRPESTEGRIFSHAQTARELLEKRLKGQQD